MALTPLVSVVMSVYNGADKLAETIDSILEQEGVELEFIVVNDGSTDDSHRILKEYAARDSRVKVISQENRGLTRSLIIGCAAARGEYIARQDAGDVSLPGRLVTQAEILRNNPGVAMVSCGTRFIGPGGEKLYDVIQSIETADEDLWKLTLHKIRGPSHHGSVVFRKIDYLYVGGYRAQFQVAQDLDLWTRLVERGKHITIQKILYVALFSHDGISSRKRKQQVNTTKLILECSRRRRSGKSEEELLHLLSKLETSAAARIRCGDTDASYYYFIASCLRKSEPKKAKNYYKQALICNPYHFKALVRFLSIRNC